MSMQKTVRAIAMLICLALMIGAGACGVLGLAVMAETPFNLSLAGFTALGLGSCAVFGFFLKKIFASRQNSDANKSEPG
jgi:hypothetical protein